MISAFLAPISLNSHLQKLRSGNDPSTMLHTLDTTLKSLLDDTSTPNLVRNAEVAFDRPSESYNPDKTTINIFLYDIRENAELRSNEPVIERQNGMVTMRRPPMRVNCSYLVTAWIESGITGEEAILKQHELLGEVLRVFTRWPSIPLPTPDEKGKHLLQGELKNTLYPISLVTAQTDLMRNLAEFWSALGGKLRPSFTLTATLAMDQHTEPVTAPEVTTKKVVLKGLPNGTPEAVFQVGGTVRDATTHKPIKEVELMLVESGMQAKSNTDGQFSFGGLSAGNYSVRAVKQGYQTRTKSTQVPGPSPTAFDIDLTT